jgi:hypothetical protein
MTTTCWADALSARERATLARKLSNACHAFYWAPEPRRRRGGDPLTGRMARRMSSADMAELHLDVTERAEVPV